MSELTYKGYTGSIIASIEDECLHGKILFIDDIITYEGGTVSEIHKAFNGAVDRYIAYCDATGSAANKPYSGTFNIRIGSDLHQQAAQIAHKMGLKLNPFVMQAIQEKVKNNGVTKIEHTVNHVVTIKGEDTPDIRTATTNQPVSWEEAHASTSTTH